MNKDAVSLSSSGVSSNEDNDTSSEASGGTVDSWSNSSLSFSMDEDSNSSSTKYNIENCTDFHVGPKLFAENCHINLNGEHNLVAKVTEKLMGQVEFKNQSINGNGSLSIKKKWRIRKAHLYAIGLTVWLSIVTFVVLVVLKEERILQGWEQPIDSVTTAKESFTTPLHGPVTPSTDVPLIVTTTSPTTYQIPTSTTTQTIAPNTQTEPPKTTENLFPVLASRDSWHGLQPPQKAARNRTAVRSIIVDNLRSDRCSGEANCSRILQSIENKTQTALNYNFLIDDSGIIYEARGWYYASDELTPFSIDLIKFGFIGSYEDSHLTTNQKTALSSFISQYWSDFKATPLIKAQCCRDIDDEKGPDANIACDLYDSEQFLVDTECLSEVKNCDNRSWIWKYFTSNKFTCDESSVLNYLVHLI